MSMMCVRGGAGDESSVYFLHHECVKFIAQPLAIHAYNRSSKLILDT